MQLYVINAAHSGYRRAGRAFSNGQNGPFKPADFSDDQLEALNNDPHLTVLAEGDDEAGAPVSVSVDPEMQGQVVGIETVGDTSTLEVHVTGSAKNPVNHVEAAPAADTAPAHGDAAAEAATPAPAGEAVPAATAAKPRAPRGTKAKTE